MDIAQPVSPSRPTAAVSQVAIPKSSIPIQQGKRKFVVDLSSLPLQILLHLNIYYFALYWIIELILYVYKGIILPFPDVGGTLGLEVVLLCLIAVIESFRLFFGYKGNLGERKQTLSWSIILAIPILVSQIYLMFWQTYVLRLEVILCSILFAIVGLEFLLSIATVFSFQRHETVFG